MSNAHTTTDSILAARGAGHTPGPWSWSELPCAGIEVRGPYKDGTRLLFSDIWRQFPEPLWDEEMRANARLIAAAPELLSTVRMLLTAIENIGGEHVTGMEHIGTALEVAYDIVAKATGEQA